MTHSDRPEGTGPVPLPPASGVESSDRLVEGIPVRTYRGKSLAELAPRIRAELGEHAMILRQREGVTGGIGGFFAKRTVEVDVAVLQVPGTTQPSVHIDVADGPAIGPPQATVSFDALRPPLPASAAAPDDLPEPPALPAVPAGPVHQPTVPFAQIAEQHGIPPGAFTVGAPSAAEAAGVEAALRADQEAQAAERARAQAEGERLQAEALAARARIEAQAAAAPPAPYDPYRRTQSFEPLDPPAAPLGVPAPAHDAIHEPPAPAPEPPQAVVPATPPAPAPRPPFTEAPFDPGSEALLAEPFGPSPEPFAEQLRKAGLDGEEAIRTGDPAAELGPLHGALVARGIPDQIATPVADDTLCHRVPLQPGRSVRDLLVSELARRIPTQPLAGRAGQAVAFVGTSGAGKTRAIARLATAYAKAGRVPVVCVTLQDSGRDGQLTEALAPFGVAVHAAPDAARARDRITALRRHALVLIDTPGVSPGDRLSLDRLAATLELLGPDEVALCLPVVLAAPIARRVLRTLKPLGPTVLVATHADEADLLGGVVAVAIDRRVPLAYISAGAGRGTIVGADAHELAGMLTGPEWTSPHDPRPAAAEASVAAAPPASGAPQPAEVPAAVRPIEPVAPRPAVDVSAGAGHLAAPWIVSSPLRPPTRG